MFDDTGKSVQESDATLRAQQSALVRGVRDVQMFPKGTKELRLPVGFSRLETPRGVFHYNESRVDADAIETLSRLQKENLLLALGPFSKQEVLARAEEGEPLLVVTEYTSYGVEYRSAATVGSFLKEVVEYFLKTKDLGGVVAVTPMVEALGQRIAHANS